MDNFSDGNLTEMPTWKGDLNDFIVNPTGQLQLNASTAGTSIIGTTTSIVQEMEWNFFVKLDFNPSTSNAVRIYLQADKIDLLNSSGYFLEIGESGSNDAIKFYRQDSGTKLLLGAATTDAVAITPMVKIQVIRTNENDWQIFTDYAGGNNLTLDLTANDTTYNQANIYFFGFYCKYTATRLTDFFFDDVAITPLTIDTFPPLLNDIKIIDEQTIHLFFNEPILENSATNINNYLLNQGIGKPLSANQPAANQVNLVLEKPFSNNENYTLTINNISDLNGNSLMTFDTIFLFSKIEVAEQYDILINEIMEDPTLDGGGTLGLPAEEYVELYNRSNKTINLEGFVFTDGSNRIATFPAYLIQPNTYLTIGKTTANALIEFGDFLGLPNFPTLSGEEELVLKNEFGETIDVVSYTQDWYGNSTTASGGYALERRNPNNPCLGAINWQGATSFLGGTPSNENSVFEIIADLPLNLVAAYPINSNQIQLSFDKAITLESLLEVDNYAISNNKILAVSLIENNFTTLLLELENPLIDNQIDTITIATTFEDCLENPITGQATHLIALPILPSSNDLAINEILFNPQTGGVDFIEFFNRSEKVIDLNGLILANQALDNPQIKAIDTKKLIFPNDFVVLTESPADIQSRYTVQDSTAIFAQDLPTFEDKEGNIQLYTNDGLTTIFIDEFDYSTNFHTPLLNDKNGVSLERVNPDAPTQGAGNWHSASSESGYATPTYQNSQFTELTANATNTTIFSLTNNRVSPDGDGFEDFLQINYKTDQSGYTATIHIYDANGQLINKIAQNELLATQGIFKWEGVSSDGQKAPIGIYVLWIEYFNLNGSVKQMKEAVVVAGKL